MKPSLISRLASLFTRPAPAPSSVSARAARDERGWDVHLGGAARALNDLPVFPALSALDSVAPVVAALREFEGGTFARAAQVCDAFGSDDRIKGVLDTRVDALFGLQREILPSSASWGGAAATALHDDWDRMFPAAELKTFMRWGLLLRVSFGRLEVVERGLKETKFRFRCWDPRWARWNWDTRSFWTLVDGGTEVEITPGRNGWVVYAPDGLQRGWMQGLVRSLALLYLVRRWTLRDWARRSETLGQTIKKAITPIGGADEEDKAAFERSVKNIGRESVFRLAQDENGKGFDVELLEAQPGGEESFRQLIATADECIAVDVLGQNLTTKAGATGSNAAANVHDRVRIDRLQGDAQSLGPCLREQAVAPWAEANFGSAAAAPLVGWQTNTHVAVDPQSGLAGAQVAAFQNVLIAVARGQIPRASGVLTLVRCFPVTEEQAEEAMGEIGRGFTPTPLPTPAPEGPPPSDQSNDKDEDTEDGMAHAA